jgi:hypothetical protein
MTPAHDHSTSAYISSHFVWERILATYDGNFSLLLNFREYVVNCGRISGISSTTTMEIDPSPTRPNDELEFIQLTGINDYDLDQQLAGAIEDLIQDLDLRKDIKRVSKVVLMLLAQQLPAQLQYRLKCTSELEGAAHERLLGLLDEAIRSGKYSKLRRLSMPLASLRDVESTNSLQRAIAKKSSRAGSTQRVC